MVVDSLVLARSKAARLYRAGNLSTAEIADRVGVARTTLRGWIKEYHWDIAVSTEEARPVRPRAAAKKRKPAGTAGSRRKPDQSEPLPAPAAPELPQAPVPAAPPQQPATRAALHSFPSRAVLVSRLYAAIDRNLKLLEQRMSDDTTPSAADGERDTRALGTAIRNIEKVTELEAGTNRNAGPAPRGRGREFTDEEARQIRLELAERILRLRRASESEE